MEHKKILLCVPLVLLLLTACESEKEAPALTVNPYDDIRASTWSGDNKSVYEESDYSRDDIFTFTFNEGTVLKGSEDLQAQMMEEGKDPGLGVRSIHEQGITGAAEYLKANMLTARNVTDRPGGNYRSKPLDGSPRICR